MLSLELELFFLIFSSTDMDYGNNILREYAPEMDQISKDCLVNVSLRGYMLPVIWMLVVSLSRGQQEHIYGI